MTKRYGRALLIAGSLCGALVASVSCSSSTGGTDSPAGAAGSAAGGASVGGSGGMDLSLAGSADQAGSSGAPGPRPCPLYSARCGGACISTSVDPNNCGGCGKTCAADEACSAGACTAKCIPGFSICQRACVDFENDSAHCGACDNACKSGQGCANGRCVDVVPVGPDPKQCVGGGPAISVGNGTRDCLGTLAQTTFRWSLCSCTDLNVSAALNTDAYDSSAGPYQPGELGGGVGVDRDVSNWSEAVTVGGTLWIAGSAAYSSSGPPSAVKSDLHLAGSWQASTPFSVAGNAYVAGTLAGVTVKGKTEKPQSVAKACDCAADQLVPVAEIVKAHRSPNNDNAAIGLAETALEKPGSAARLDLPCGNFYLASIQSSLALTVHVHGRTALYVEGDVSASSSLAFTLEPDAELDLFIGGTLKASNTFVFGSPNYPALSRLYVAGTAKIALSADVRLAGEFYAANSAQVVWSAKNAIYGSVFAGNFRASDVTNIHYDRAVLRAGDYCPPDPLECGSCEDCHNQACKNGVCGDCGSDSDCCSPLVCIDGSCVSDVVVK